MLVLVLLAWSIVSSVMEMIIAKNVMVAINLLPAKLNVSRQSAMMGNTLIPLMEHAQIAQQDVQLANLTQTAKAAQLLIS